jgi:hypothetical protein
VRTGDRYSNEKEGKRMKISRLQKPPAFNPFEITISIETYEEWVWLKRWSESKLGLVSGISRPWPAADLQNREMFKNFVLGIHNII